MKHCTKHRVIWEENKALSGCVGCLKEEVENLKAAVTRAQRDSTADVKRRRKAEWEVLRLRDELKEMKEAGRDLIDSVTSATREAGNLVGGKVLSPRSLQ